MNKIKIAQIGTGHDHAIAPITLLKQLSDTYELIGYCSVPEDSNNLPRFSYEGNKRFYEGVSELTLEEILNYPGLEAVCIETEDRALTKYALMAAEKGLHIYMDKPGEISGDEFERLIDTAVKNGCELTVGYMYRYNPAVLKLKEDIAAGKFGDIISVEAQMNCKHEPDKRRWLANYPGGMLYYLGCHMVDLVYSIMGEPENVIPLSRCSGLDGVEAEDFGMAVFEYKNGVSIAQSTAVETGGFERRQLVVIGTKGTVELRPFEWRGESSEIFCSQITGVREAFDSDWHKKGEYHNTPIHGRFDTVFREFASYIRGEAVNPYGCEYERRLHRLLLKACGVKSEDKI